MKRLGGAPGVEAMVPGGPGDTGVTGGLGDTGTRIRLPH